MNILVIDERKGNYGTPGIDLSEYDLVLCINVDNTIKISLDIVDEVSSSTKTEATFITALTEAEYSLHNAQDHKSLRGADVKKSEHNYQAAMAKAKLALGTSDPDFPSTVD